MAKTLDIKDVIQVTTTWKEDTPKDIIPDDCEGILSRQHARKDGPKWGLHINLLSQL